MRPTLLEDIVENLPCSFGEDLGVHRTTADVAKVSNIGPEGDFRGEFEKRSFDPHDLARLTVKTGDLLVVKSSGNEANILSGKTAISGPLHEGKLVASNFLLRLRPDPAKVWPPYLRYFLNSSQSKAFVKSIVGAFTYPNLNWGLYCRHPVPLPSLSGQQRIAGQLEQADRLRRTRRYALELSDTLLPAAFNSMFGSEAECLKRWPVARLDDCCHRITDGTHLTPEFLSAGVPFIFVKNIDNGSIDFRTDKFISEETHRQLYGRCPVERDDVLYTIVGATYGQAVLVGDFTKFAFQRHIAHLKPDDQVVLPKFLASVMNLPVGKTQADRWARGAAQPTINLKELKEFKIPVPPLPKQEQFAVLVARHERLRAVQRESLRQAEHFFQSLLHHAFKGER